MAGGCGFWTLQDLKVEVMILAKDLAVADGEAGELCTNY